MSEATKNENKSPAVFLSEIENSRPLLVGFLRLNCTHTHIHTHMHLHIHIHTHAHTPIRTHIHAHSHTHIHSYCKPQTKWIGIPSVYYLKLQHSEYSVHSGFESWVHLKLRKQNSRLMSQSESSALWVTLGSNPDMLELPLGLTAFWTWVTNLTRRLGD